MDAQCDSEGRCSGTPVPNGEPCTGEGGVIGRCVLGACITNPGDPIPTGGAGGNQDAGAPDAPGGPGGSGGARDGSAGSGGGGGGSSSGSGGGCSVARHRTLPALPLVIGLALLVGLRARLAGLRARFGRQNGRRS